MCFVLFAGLDNPLPLREWKKEAPDVCVEELSEHEARVRVHFSKTAVQYIGSTSGCGCDFPYWVKYNPGFPDPEFDPREPEQRACNYRNSQALVDMLRASGESIVELYGVWSGDESVPPRAVEEIPLTAVLKPEFHFREQVFYRVTIEN